MLNLYSDKNMTVSVTDKLGHIHSCNQLVMVLNKAKRVYLPRFRHTEKTRACRRLTFGGSGQDSL